MMNLQILNQLGLVGVPLLICSAMMLAIVVERLLFFLATKPVSQQAFDRLYSTQQFAGDGEEAIRKNYFGRIIYQLIDNRHLPNQERESFCSLQLLVAENTLSRYLPILKILVTVCPLLGLLGTVLGMIEAFSSISSFNRPITPALVADGVSRALLTTAVGLVLAIPGLIAHSLFQVRIDKLIHRLTLQLNHLNLKLQLTSDKNPINQESL